MIRTPNRESNKSDLFSWREIFQLYVEAEVFESVGEQTRGELTVEESEKRLKLFAERATQRGLGDSRKFKLKQSREALESFLGLNLFILNVKKVRMIDSSHTFFFFLTLTLTVLTCELGSGAQDSQETYQAHIATPTRTNLRAGRLISPAHSSLRPDAHDYAPPNNGSSHWRDSPPHHTPSRRLLVLDMHEHRVQTNTFKLRASLLREVLGKDAETGTG